MSQENKEILFEGRDTQNRTILVFGIGLFAVMAAAAVLMIPLHHYLWNLVKDPNAAPAAAISTPAVVLEVLPSQELVKMRTENEAENADEKIAKAMKDTLAQGFSVKS